jgi:hypothetical protein
MTFERTPTPAKKKSKPKELVPFREVQKRLRLFREHYEGVRPIPVESIIGSVDKSAQFDRKFRPRAPEQRERVRQVTLYWPEGDFPPIRVFQVGDAFFVRDGHIRVAAAKDMGIDYVDAEITSLETRETLPADADLVDVIHLELRQRLLTETGLGSMRPSANIRVSLPVGYTKIRESIAVHGYRLFHERGGVLSRHEVAGDWFDRVYEPAVEAIRRAGLIDAVPHSTETDLFLWIEERRRAMFVERGPVEVDEVAREAGQEAKAKPQNTTETKP